MLTIQVKAVPSSGRQIWAFDKSETLKCFLKNPPEKGLANRELIKRIAKLCSVTQDQVEIIQGSTSRKKVIKINTPLTYEQFLDLLGLKIHKDERQAQQPLFDGPSTGSG